MTGASAEAQAYAVRIKEGTGSSQLFAEQQRKAQAELKATAVASNGASKAMQALAIAGNMIAMWAITKGIQLAKYAFDAWNVTVEESKEKVDTINSKLEELNSQLTELRDKEILTDYESNRLKQLEQEVALQERLLEIEQKRLYQNQIGTGFSDYFDEESLLSKQMAEEDRRNKEGYKYLSRGFKVNESDLQIINKQIEQLESDIADTVNPLVLESLYDSLNKAIERRNKLLEDQTYIEEQLTLNSAEYLQNYQVAQEAIDSGLLTGDDLEKAKAMADYWHQMYFDSQGIIANIQKETGTYDNSDEIAEKLNGILAKADFQKATEQIKDLGEKGQLSVSTLSARFPELIEYLDNAGISAQDLYDYIMALSGLEPSIEIKDNTDYDAIKKQFMESLGIRGGEIRSQKENDAWEYVQEQIEKLGDQEIVLDAYLRIVDQYGEHPEGWDAKDWLLHIQSELDTQDLEVGIALFDASTTITQLNERIKPAFDSLKSAWQDIFTDDGFALNEIDIISTCNSIKDKLDEITELGFELDYSAYEDFIRVLSNSESTAEDVDKAFDSLATSITDAALSGVEDFEIMKAALEDLGVVNNELVAFDALISNTEALKEAGLDLVAVSEMEADEADNIITAFAEEMVSTDNLSQAIAMLTFQKELCNLQTMDTSDEIANLRSLAENAGYTGEVIQYLTELEEIYQNVASGVWGTNTQQVAMAKTRATELTKLISESANKVEYKPQVDFNGAKNDAKKAGSSAGKAYKDAFKEEVDNLKSVLSGIIGLIDKQIDSYENEKDAAVSSLRAELEARISVIEAQKEQLQNQIDLIDAEIKSKEKAISLIEDEINAIKDANEERKRQIDLQKAQYELERMQNQRTILQYSEEKGMHYVTDTNGVRDAKQDVENAKLEIEIANKEKQIQLIEKEIDLLEERKDAINEQIDLLDAQIDQINDYYDKLISETERYWDSLIKNMEDYKSRWEELQQVEDQAKLIAQLKELGITTDDITNMSAEAFEKFKDRYLAALIKVNEGNADVQNSIAELGGSAGSIEPVSDAINDTADSMDNLSGSVSTAGQSVSNTASNLDDAATSAGALNDNLTNVNTTISEEQSAFDNLKKTIDDVIEAINDKITAIQEEQNAVGIATSSEMADFLLLRDKIIEVKESIDEVTTTVTDLDAKTLDNITNSFQELYDKIIIVSGALGSGIEGSGEGVTNSISSAIQALNDISLEEGIIAQFNNLKTAIDSVTSALSGGGGESSGGQSQGGQSASSDSGSGGKGAADSLTDAITTMGETANEVIGEPQAEGDGTVIGEFGSMKTAVNDVTEAIGIGGEEGSGDGGGQGEDNGTLIGSINDLGTTSEETLGESGGDGVIGKFEQFRDVIGEANEHVHSISDGLAAIDGQEVECTIKVNIETSSGIGGLGFVNGSMNLDSAEYNAKYGAAHVEGTALVSGNWAVQSEERNALVGELGRELIVFPDGHFETVGDAGAQFVNIPKNSIVFNHLQTEALLKNGHISGRGKAYADGTVGDKFASGVFRPLQPGDHMYELLQKMNEHLAKTGEDVNSMLSPVNVIKRDIDQMSQPLSNINNINNTKTQSINIGDINVTCPNVTSKEVARQIGTEVNSLFSGLHLDAYQQSKI